MNPRHFNGVSLVVAVAGCFVGYPGGAPAQLQDEGPQPNELYSTAEASGLAPKAPQTVMNVQVEVIPAVVSSEAPSARVVPKRMAAKTTTKGPAEPSQQPGPAGNWQGVVSNPAVSEQDASNLVGKSALSSRGEELGEISALVRSASNDSLHAVVDVGGFLGIGERLVALPLQQGRIDRQGNLRVSVSRDYLEGMREYEP
jgi:hypothetical protein